MSHGISRDEGWAEAREGTLRVAAVLTMVLGALLWVGPAILRVDIFDGDAAQHVFWLYRYADPALFPADITVAFSTSMAPLGYRLLYAGIAPVMDALLATKLLAAAAFLAAGGLAWKIGAVIDGPDRALRGLLAVVALAVVVSLGYVLPNVAFQRTFALPLMLLCLWGLVAHRYLWVGISWVGAALFYPVLLPVMGLSAGCVFLRDIWVTHRMPESWVMNGVLGASALAIALLGMPAAEVLGPMISYEQAITMPEFGPQGRLRLYDLSGFGGNWLRFHMTGLGWPADLLLAVAASAGLVWVTGRRRLIPVAAWAIVSVGVGIWLLMRVFPAQLMFDLYLPNRHSNWAIAAFGVVALAAGSYVSISIVVRFAQRLWPNVSLRAVPYLLSLAAPAVLAGMMLPRALDQWNRPLDHDLERTYDFIAAMPKDTLIAAHPTLADYIPLRTRRSVLTSTETSQPFLLGYYGIVKPRVEASLRAAYATDIAEVDAQLSPYGVDVFVTGPSVWAATDYLDPYNHEFLRDLLEHGPEHGFVLQSPPEDRVLFRSGEYYVIRVGAPGERAPVPPAGETP